jgi:membrane protease subunit (stomatin/prohibitin family)
MSMIDNLQYIKGQGMQQFLAREEAKWRCPECGQTVCCHNGVCFNCGLDRLRDKKKKYRWEDD